MPPEQHARLFEPYVRSGLTQRWFVAGERASAEPLVAHGRTSAMIWCNTATSSEAIEPFGPVEWVAVNAAPPTIVVDPDPGGAPTTTAGTPVAFATRVVRSSPETLIEALHALKRATSGAGGDHG